LPWPASAAIALPQANTASVAAAPNIIVTLIVVSLPELSDCGRMVGRTRPGAKRTLGSERALGDAVLRNGASR
jgi:hypothetical protein